MQSLNNISTFIAKDSAAGGSSTSSAPSLGADFAAMLFELSASEQKGLNGIFSAIAKIHSTNQGVGARLPLSSSKNSHTASNSADKSSAFEKSSLKRSDSSDDDERTDKNEEEKDHVSSAYDDTCQWMNALLDPAVNPDESYSDAAEGAELSADENVADDILLSAKAADKSKNNSAQAVLKQLNADKSTAVLQDFGKSLTGTDSLQESTAVKNEEASLAYIMAQSGVKDLKISDSSQLSLLDKNAEELGFIDDSLHALQDLDNSDLSQNSSNQSKNLNYALSQLRESLSTNDGQNVNAAAFAQGDGLTDLNDAQYSNAQERAELIDEITGASQGISDARAMSLKNRASQLRSDMLTLSSDVRKNAEEISKAVMTMAARNMKRFSFDLNPNGLGRMEISIDADDNDNAVSVTIAAQELATRRLVSQSLDALKLALYDHGVDAKASMTEFSGDGNFSERQQERGSQEHTGILFAENSLDDEDVEQPSAVENTESDGTLNLFA